MKKFFIGFLSAFIAPITKIYSTGFINLSELNFSMVLGAFIPLLLMGILVGLYAIIVNAGETNMKRLFVNCLSVPALLIALVSGETSTQLIDNAYAKDLEPKLINCDSVSDVSKGILQTISNLTGKKYTKYYVVSEEYKKQEKYVLVDKKKYYIDFELNYIPKTGTIFDTKTCKIVMPEPKK